MQRDRILPEKELPPGSEVLAEGRALATTWTVGPSQFLDYYEVDCEASYKQRCMEQGRIMQHAHMGFRSANKSRDAFQRIYDAVAARGGRIDRFGLCLDWSMGFPASIRSEQLRGTGLILQGPEQFAEIANTAPVASHFGDFVLGFPAALENTQAALSAGSTVIGNLGQYFTFRLPEWSDDLATTRSTLNAIGLMAAQPVTVMVHSNLDDGFAAVFEDLGCALGAAMLERYIIEDLAGARITHCFGHHYTTPLLRMAFQRALHRASPNPGSMIYGNTTSYRGGDAENFASLGSYLTLDIIGQKDCPSGHAINPVPVTENRRIPDIDEITDAQLFANRMVAASEGYRQVMDESAIIALADQLYSNGTLFFDRCIKGLDEAGIDTTDAFEMLLAIRRIGGSELERLYGTGEIDALTGYRQPVVMADTTREISAHIQKTVSRVAAEERNQLENAGLVIVVATTDVHVHGKMLVQGLLQSLGCKIIDGGASANPHELAQLVEQHQAVAIALSTYNGVALTYYCQLRDELREAGLDIPVLIGGQLNQIPEDSADSLPVSVEEKLQQEGAKICRNVLDAIPLLLGIKPIKFNQGTSDQVVDGQYER